MKKAKQAPAAGRPVRGDGKKRRKLFIHNRLRTAPERRRSIIPRSATLSNLHAMLCGAWHVAKTPRRESLLRADFICIAAPVRQS
jgi:hypothetical protein